jgi:DNA-binding LytR/AlgR family response regulator
MSTAVRSSQGLFIASKHRHRKVSILDILFITTIGKRQSRIVTRHGKHTVKHSLKQLADQFSLLGLFRVHRSYVVNLAAMDAFDHRYIYFNNYHIPLGGAYRNKLMDRLKVIT